MIWITLVEFCQILSLVMANMFYVNRRKNYYSINIKFGKMMIDLRVINTPSGTGQVITRLS